MFPCAPQNRDKASRHIPSNQLADSPSVHSERSSISMDGVVDPSNMTPASSHTAGTSPHGTPLNQPLNHESFPPLPGMFNGFNTSNTGYTPLPQENPLSPVKNPWMQILPDEQDMGGIYSELFQTTQYWK